MAEHRREGGSRRCTPPVRLDEMDRRQSLRVGQIGQQPVCLAVLEWQVGNSTVPIEANEDSRDETAETAVGVVEERRASAHRSIVANGGIRLPVLS